MGTHTLFVPTTISHSSFKDNKNKTIHLSEKEINYFYSLLYLYRENLINDNKKDSVFIKSDKKENIINPTFTNFKVKIDLVEFNNLEIVGNYGYADLEKLLLKLYQIRIEVNIFGKNRDVKSKIIDMIKDISLDEKNTLLIEFTTEFAKMILHTKKYFIEVDLDILFCISGYKSKKIYLILKDYCNLAKKNIILSKSELSEIIGLVPQKNKFNEVLKNINFTHNKKESNVKTDIEICKVDKNKEDYYLEHGNKKVKDYQFYFKNLSKPKVTEKVKPKLKPTVNKELMNTAKKEMKKVKSQGTIIKNEEAYLNTAYTNLVEKNKPYEKTDSDVELEYYINESTALLKVDEEINYTKKNYLMLSVGNNDYFIQNDYTLLNRFERNNTTKDSTETLEFINNNNIKIDMFTAQGNGIKDCDIGLISYKE